MQKIFVALSGGVDSAVAAHMLKEAGHKVTGVFIRVWQPDFLPCNQDEEERAAKRVAAHLGIPFLRCDLTDEYKRDVVDTMVAEYKKGNTPNPDVLCNAHIKFGAFLKWAKERGAEKIATGHHAQVLSEPLSPSRAKLRYQLVRGADTRKDQSYFLWKLTQEELSHTLMPIGHMQKEEVRAYAEKHTLPSAYKPDSQGLCFIGHVDMKTFLKHFIATKEGVVLNENGEVVGHHDGAEFITIGQRSGFTLNTKDVHRTVHYVVAKDLVHNTITVSPHHYGGSTAIVSEKHKTHALTDANFTQNIDENKQYTCEIRYHGEVLTCRVAVGNAANATISFAQPQLVASGQSIVVYDDNHCLGGGVVA